MQKIPTIYLRSEDHKITNETHPDCFWVFKGEGVATEKFDGSACIVIDNTLYRRHRVKPGKMYPPEWVHWNFDKPEATGHGWAMVAESTADQYHLEAWDALAEPLNGCTYELVGPNVQGNPYKLKSHELWGHGKMSYKSAPTDQEGLKVWLGELMPPMEGIVWHHPDGRMAKIKRRDLGLGWPA